LSKKGAYDLGRKSVYFIVVAFVLVLVFAFVGSFFSGMKIKQVDELKPEEYKAYFYSVLDCIGYENSREYFNVIDFEKINSNVLEKCLKDKTIGIDLKFEDSSGNCKVLNDDIQVKIPLDVKPQVVISKKVLGYNKDKQCYGNLVIGFEEELFESGDESETF